MLATSSESSGGKPLFVSGATGRHGGTGHAVVGELLKKGARVRALARVDDERAASRRSAGAEVVIGDLHDHRTQRSSLEGVEAASFTYPMKFGSIEAAANFAAAARAARVPRMVLPLTTVDNSDFAPTRLTAHPTLLRISKQFLPHLSSNED